MTAELHQYALFSVTSLNVDFTHLLLRVCHILSSSPNNQDNLKICKDFCTLLKISDSSNEPLFSHQKIAMIKKCHNFKELFNIISTHMSWDEHSILTQIVDHCNSVEGQQEIEKFERKLALCQGLQIISSTSKQSLSEDFVKFCIINDKPYKNITTEEYKKVKAYIFDNLDVKVCNYLHTYVCMYIGEMYTVGPRLSEHLCATSMLKVFR